MQNLPSYNIFITVSNSSIEHYDQCKLKISLSGTYIINTSGGSVTFRYMSDQKCWLIENQLMGNARLK